MTAPNEPRDAVAPEIANFDEAYAKALATSDPDDWMTAALYGRQLRIAIAPRDAEIERLRETNRELHRRAQKAESFRQRWFDGTKYAIRRMIEARRLRVAACRERNAAIARAEAAEARATASLRQAQDWREEARKTNAALSEERARVAGMRTAFGKVALIQARELARLAPDGNTPVDLDEAMLELRHALTPEPPHDA